MTKETTMKLLRVSDLLAVNNGYKIIELTEEMKTKCPSLKEYNEFFMCAESMNWWDADRYACDHFAQLPSSEELKDILKLIDTTVHYQFRCWWTREVYAMHSRFALAVHSDLCASSSAEKYTSYAVFCLRR